MPGVLAEAAARAGRYLDGLTVRAGAAGRCGRVTPPLRRPVEGAMRISVSSWAATDEDVEKSPEAMLRIAARVTN